MQDRRTGSTLGLFHPSCWHLPNTVGVRLFDQVGSKSPGELSGEVQSELEHCAPSKMVASTQTGRTLRENYSTNKHLSCSNPSGVLNPGGNRGFSLTVSAGGSAGLDDAFEEFPAFPDLTIPRGGMAQGDIGISGQGAL